MLDLSVLDYQDDGAWGWRLSDVGAVLARHEVRLDRGSAEFRLLTDLYRNLWRLEAARAFAPGCGSDRVRDLRVGVSGTYGWTFDPERTAALQVR